MAISAQRFKFLDNETNIPVADFAKIADNFVYNIPSLTNISDQLQGLLKNELNGLLSNITSNLPNVDSLISNGFGGGADILNSLKSSLGNFNNLLSSNSTISNLLNSVGSLSVGNYVDGLIGNGLLGNLVSNAVTGYVSNSIKPTTGSRLTFLTNSICKSASRNYSTNLDIMSLLGLRFSSNFLSNHCSIMNNKIANKPSSVLSYTPLSGVVPDSSSALNIFKSLIKDYASFQTKQSQKTPPIEFDPTQLATAVSNGSYDSLLSTVSNAGFASSSQKDSYLNGIDSYLSSNSIDPMSEVGQNLINLKSSISGIGVSPFSTTNQANSMFMDPSSRFLSDNLGSFLKNSTSLSFDNLYNYASPGTNDYKLLTNVMIPAINSAKSNYDLLNRDINIGSFSTFDFSNIIPEINDPELSNYITTNSVPSTSYKLYDLDSTSNSIAIDVPQIKLNQTKVYDNSVYTPYTLDTTDLERLDPFGITSDNLTASKAIYSCQASDYYSSNINTNSSSHSYSSSYSSYSSSGYTSFSSSSSFIGDPDVGDISSDIESSISESMW